MGCFEIEDGGLQDLNRVADLPQHGIAISTEKASHRSAPSETVVMVDTQLLPGPTFLLTDSADAILRIPQHVEVFSSHAVALQLVSSGVFSHVGRVVSGPLLVLRVLLFLVRFVPLAVVRRNTFLMSLSGLPFSVPFGVSLFRGQALIAHATIRLLLARLAAIAPRRTKPLE